MCLITKNGGEIILDSLDGVSTTCLDTGLPISPDDGGKLPAATLYPRRVNS